MHSNLLIIFESKYKNWRVFSFMASKCRRSPSAENEDLENDYENLYFRFPLMITKEMKLYLFFEN